MRQDPTITTDVKGAAVDELPPRPRASSPRTNRYAEVLKAVREEVGAGKWVPIATFAGRGGATVVKRALVAGERPVDGDVSDWAFEARKDDQGGSVLWAQLQGYARSTPPAKKATKATKKVAPK